MIESHWNLSLAAMGLLWPAFHFAVYYCFLRKLRPFKTERGIFLFHFLSYLALIAVFVCCLLFSHMSRHAFAEMVLSLSIHGVYSLSFLELWSLSQGSYSLQILELIAVNRELPVKSTFQAGGDIGAVKHGQRLESLRRIGLLSAKGRLTVPGRIAAFVMYGILIVSSGRSFNT